jgi:hypothetical protein
MEDLQRMAIFTRVVEEKLRRILRVLTSCFSGCCLRGTPDANTDEHC